MRNHRVLALIGSAAAAALGLFAILFVSPRNDVVHAGTILDSFRDSLRRGVRVMFQNVGAEGVHLDGQIAIHFGAEAAAPPAGGDRQTLNIEQLFADLHAVGDADSTDMNGLDARVVLATSPEASWTYLKTASLPEKLLDEQPLLRGFASATRNGLLIDADTLKATVASDNNGGLRVTRTLTSSGGVGLDDAAMQDMLQKAASDAAAKATAPGGRSGVFVTHDVKFSTALGGEALDDDALAAVKSAIESALKSPDAENEGSDSLSAQVAAAVKSALGDQGGARIVVTGPKSVTVGSPDLAAAIEQALRSALDDPDALQISTPDAADPPVEQAIHDAVVDALAADGEHVQVIVQHADGARADDPAIQEAIRKALADKSQGGRRLSIGIGAGSRGATVGGATLAFSVDSDDTAQDSFYGSLVREFVNVATGRGDSAAMDRLMALVERASAESQVDEIEPGLFVLTAGRLDSDDPALGDAVLRIAYRPESGVVWAELQDVGDYAGLVRFELLTDPLEPELFDRARVIEPGVTTVLDKDDPSALLKLFFLGGAAPSAAEESK